MGDYGLAASHPTGTSGYGPGVTGITYPRKAMSSLTASSWGTGIAWSAAQLRANISGISGTMYVRVFGSCTVTASTANGNIGLAVYKNGAQVNTGVFTQYLGGNFGQPFPLSIEWCGSVAVNDFIELYLISAAAVSLSAVNDVVFTVLQTGGASLQTNTNLNSANPQWSICELTADNGTVLSTLEVSALPYIGSSRVTSTGADSITQTPPFSLNKVGVYQITACLLFKSINATAQAITIRLKVGGITLVTRQVQLPTAANGYFGGFIDYAYNLASGTTTVDVTIQSNVVNNYILASGSSVGVKCIRRNVV
jgi:hypothetical protein